MSRLAPEAGENMKDCLKRDHTEVVHTGVFNEKETLMNFWRNLCSGALPESFEEKHPETYKDAFTRAVMQVQKDEKYRLKRELEEAFSYKRKGGAPEFISALPTDPHSPKDMF
ncbi:hypothetical protein Ddye_028561 [Dipteronia dyeriana]|uniref:Uncharacterized protein n=1 Tax=Dipteronia dyeriana TaxID=168575 RepID=A0AAD9TDW4_9ROSI|nr:hypothetical protein Ddye_028561 [Dipteronia dyeriana]